MSFSMYDPTSQSQEALGGLGSNGGFVVFELGVVPSLWNAAIQLQAWQFQEVSLLLAFLVQQLRGRMWFGTIV